MVPILIKLCILYYVTEYYYQISLQDDNLETNLVTFPNTRRKRSAEPLIATNITTNTPTTNTNSATPTHINSSIQAILDKSNGTKTTKGTY